MKLEFKVTFESDIHPPETIEGTVEASTLRACTGKAIQWALNCRKATWHWTSVVLVVIK